MVLMCAMSWQSVREDPQVDTSEVECDEEFVRMPEEQGRHHLD